MSWDYKLSEILSLWSRDAEKFVRQTPRALMFQLPFPPGTAFASLSRVNPPVRLPSIWYSTERITPSATVGPSLTVGEQPATQRCNDPQNRRKPEAGPWGIVV
jgi:hypothetical protein